MEASSSERPPERKVIPGTAGGTVLSRVLIVYSTILSGVTSSVHSAPRTVIKGFNKKPSKKTPLSTKTLYTIKKTFS
jgi:hypothetical protein